MSEPGPAPASPRPREIIPCAKCNAENLAGATRCHECGAHLYLGCPACGAGNLRTLKHCAKCGARLGRSRLNRIKDRLFRRFTVLETFAGITLLAGLIWLLVRLVSAMPNPEVTEEPPPEPGHEEPIPKEPPEPEEGTEPPLGPG